ncbi:MAG TPA: YihY/virulence factor BrkB family protein [Candidatus Krumholzibacteria bacterium]|nr:YihY/virulence factor BrkB family protein [Candidatus Krumholzibacteria bacterium]
MLPRTAWHLTRWTIESWWTDNALRLAAAMSYYITFSLAPLLLIVIAVAGLLMGNNNARDAIMQQARTIIGTSGADALEAMMKGARRPATGILAGTIGVVTLLFGATGVVGQLQDALNTIWRVKPRPGRGIKRIILKRIVSFAMILGIGFLLLVSLVISAAIDTAGGYIMRDQTAFLMEAIHFLLSTAVITVLFAMMFKFLPDVRLKWHNIWFGAFVTSLLFSLGKTLTGLYIAKSSLASSYGAAGSLVIILTWVYYSSASFLLGAEFTQVFTNYREGAPEKKQGIIARPKEG